MNFLRRLFGWGNPVPYDGRELDVEPVVGQLEKRTMMISDNQLECLRFIPHISEIREAITGGIPLTLRNLGQGGYGVAKSVEFTNGRGEKRVSVQKAFKKVEEGRYEAEIYFQVQRTVSALSRGTTAFWRLSSTFVPRFIGKTVSDARKFINYYERVPGQELQKSPFMSLEGKDRKSFSSQSARVGAQIASALAVAHVSGVVHHDIKPENIVYDPSTETAKLIDFGFGFKYTRQPDEKFLMSKEDVLDALAKKPAMSRKDALKVPRDLLASLQYCSSIEEYQLKAEIRQLDKEIGLCKIAEKRRQRSEILADMALITRPAIDVYGLGMLLPSIFFRKTGERFFMKAFYPCGKCPEDAQANILNRQNFVANIEENVKNLNEELPANLRYEEAQLSFIIKLIQACTNPNPL
ncbi:MAG: hypothetical protein LBF25_01265, partial [Puniceicoccales bacterium]|nr:hypothetical protein [Puniceicoccales bacterium]